MYTGTIKNKSIVDDRPFLGPKEGLPAPNNKFQMAFGDAYCMACIDMKACKDTSIIKRMKHRSSIPKLHFHESSIPSGLRQ